MQLLNDSEFFDTHPNPGTNDSSFIGQVKNTPINIQEVSLDSIVLHDSADLVLNIASPRISTVATHAKKDVATNSSSRSVKGEQKKRGFAKSVVEGQKPPRDQLEKSPSVDIKRTRVTVDKPRKKTAKPVPAPQRPKWNGSAKPRASMVSKRPKSSVKENATK